MLMDLAALELQRSAAREAQEGPGSSAAVIAAKASAAVLAGHKGTAHKQQPQHQQLDQR